jgi:acetyltransferase-like isoleucine patch superfamily enzyme
MVERPLFWYNLKKPVEIISFRNTLSVVSNFVEALAEKIPIFYAFWVFKWLDLLGYGSIACRVRGSLLKLAGFNLGWGCILRPGLSIYSTRTPVKIGHHVFMNNNVCFDAGNAITIGNYVEIGHGTKFLNQSCELVSNYSSLRPSVAGPPIVVEDFVWIACNVTVMGGVTIGTGSVIGAGSLVNTNIPPHSFAIGVPAKVIRVLNQPTTITMLSEDRAEALCAT